MNKARVEEFLDENIELIREDNYEKLFEAYCRESNISWNDVLEYLVFECDIDVLETMKSIPRNFFKDVSCFKSIVIPENINNIESYAFYNCTMEEITINANITNLNENTFNDCKNLKKLILSEPLEVIEKSAIVLCPTLEYLYIPDSVIKIESNAIQPQNTIKPYIFMHPRIDTSKEPTLIPVESKPQLDSNHNIVRDESGKIVMVKDKVRKVYPLLPGMKRLSVFSNSSDNWQEDREFIKD